MSLVPEYPVVVGALNPAEAQQFSADFSCDPSTILPRQQCINVNDLTLFDRHTEHEGIILPDGYGQFLPAVSMAVAHEKTVRGDRQLKRVTVSVRQSTVRPGHSQQGDRPNEVHRDNGDPDFFYTMSDNHPTQYYPHIASAPNMLSQLRLTEEQLAEGVAFQPFDLVWASTMMYHRSVPVETLTRRTFLRLLFNYEYPLRSYRGRR